MFTFTTILTIVILAIKYRFPECEINWWLGLTIFLQIVSLFAHVKKVYEYRDASLYRYKYMTEFKMDIVMAFVASFLAFIIIV